MEGRDSMEETYRLRRATAEDEGFLRRLFAETHESLKTLPRQLQEPLIRMQYQGREMTYSARYPQAENWILCREDGTAAGRHLIARVQNSFHEIDLAILPEHQRRGLGTFALRQLQRRAEAEEIGMSLQVAKGSPAERLYRRLGFIPAGEEQIFRRMVWIQTKGQDSTVAQQRNGMA
jgi:GNAT superfamily N-acetyltransferase